jgi:hypothetical protein
MTKKDDLVKKLLDVTEDARNLLDELYLTQKEKIQWQGSHGRVFDELLKAQKLIDTLQYQLQIEVERLQHSDLLLGIRTRALVFYADSEVYYAEVVGGEPGAVGEMPVAVDGGMRAEAALSDSGIEWRDDDSSTVSF